MGKDCAQMYRRELFIYVVGNDHAVIIFINVIHLGVSRPFWQSRDYKDRYICSIKKAYSKLIRHGRHVVSQCSKQKYFPPVLVSIFLIFPGGGG